MIYLIAAILPAALLVAAANDVYEYKIPNWIPLTLLVFFPVAVVASGGGVSLLWQGALIGMALLVVGFALFALKAAGGGDAKLLAAAAPWFGLEAQLEFLIGTMLAGGLLALAILAFRGAPMLPIYARFSWLMNLHESEKGIPYGVAIAIGGLFAYPETIFFKIIVGG